MPFDLNKCPKNEEGHWVAQTRDGRRVIIVCGNAPGEQPLVGLRSGDGFPASWDSDGSYFRGGKSGSDLISPPTKQTALVEIWTHPTRGARALLNNGQMDDIGTSWRKVHEQKIEWEE